MERLILIGILVFILILVLAPRIWSEIKFRRDFKEAIDREKWRRKTG